MLTLPGYVIDETIHENSRVVVLRGRQKADDRPVVIKTLQAAVASPAATARLRWEYELSRSLAADGIVRPLQLAEVGPTVALIMEDSGAISLRQYLQHRPLCLEAFLDIAIQLAQALTYLHGQGIIHRDLKPENLLIHPATRQVQLIDFGAAERLRPEQPALPAPVAPVGSVQYMPPEQTGRLNRMVDGRSDLYSLGIVCYELLTGRLPWQAATQPSWVHAQIALPPQPPEQVQPGLPGAVSAVVMKLLSKAAEERYQSAYGLLQDLQYCRRQFARSGSIAPFVLGQQDIPPRPQLPRQLYGREAELERLRLAFASALQGQRVVVFVSGPAGMGKTALVMEAIQSFDLRPGWTICGKFDQLQQATPYAAFAAALGELVRQLLTGSSQELAQWKQRLADALGRNGGLLTAIVPELALVIGEQPPPEALPPQEAQNRFLLVFDDLIRAIARRGQPLVLFLDDLQWADPASLQLLSHLLCNAELDSLLFIGALRENELVAEHPLTEILAESRQEGPQPQLIRLSPLARSQAAQLVAAVLHDPEQRTAGLAEQLSRKSGGNPLFLGQLLLSIWDAGLLQFNLASAAWQWQPEQIQHLPLQQDVLELFLEKLRRIPAETLQVLQWAACLGSRFDLPTLAAVSGRTLEQLSACLLPAVQSGLVLSPTEQTPAWEFLHDRVQQAVYSGISDGENQWKHLAIGRWLLQDRERWEERILPATDHFDRSLELLTDQTERLQVAGHNLLAGRKAKATGAYAAALGYLRAGKRLLPEDAWQSAYRLCHDLHLELAQMEYLSAQPAVAEQLFEQVIAAATSELERMEVRCLQVVLLAGRGQYANAVRTGIAALAVLGIRLPVPPGPLDYAAELMSYRWALGRCLRRGQAAVPVIATDPLQTMICELLARLACIISIHNPKAYLYTIIKTSNHTVRHGNSDLAAIGYLGYGIITGSLFGNYATGQALARTGLQLAESGAGSYSKCYVNFIMGAIVCHWRQPVASGSDYLRQAVNHGREAGDLLLTGYACRFLLEIGYLSGQPLSALAERIAAEQAHAASIRHEYLTLNSELYRQVVACLQGEPDRPLSLAAFNFDEAGFMQSMQRDHASQAAYYILKMQLCYWSGDYRQAWSAAELAGERLEAVTGFLITAEFYFYQSLIITAWPDQLPAGDRWRQRRLLRRNRRRLQRWAENCPQNFRHKYLLVAAEMVRREGRATTAMSLYDQAIRLAEQHGYRQDAALACELAARFHREQGRDQVARSYLEEACRGYGAWGAAAKATALRQQYPDLLAATALERPLPAAAPSGTAPLADGAGEAFTRADLVALRRAMQAIVAASDLAGMLRAFLAFALECAGADKAVLVLEQHGDLWVEAGLQVDGENGSPIRPVPLVRSTGLSKAVVHYAFRTLETVILNHREERTIFSADPYLTQMQIRSTACLPIFFAGIPAGVIYLENSLLAGAFSSDRLELLTLLSAQLVAVRRMQDYLEESAAPAKLAAPLVEALTAREADVLRLIAAGLSNREIADRLGLTANTVKGYIKNIYGKLGANRRVQVVARAKELGLLPSDQIVGLDSGG